ncbi:uncharacterized protein LOC128272631 [Anopheles cruzii]|uniref:uncharacterized protein LOC128272631 n=1 Tax=Anopheles cruzii TaxID=68878 RepID=UPI0022EC4574|nr:uncharacterized protein LOC128272631 [Anopheles cruzii]
MLLQLEGSTSERVTMVERLQSTGAHRGAAAAGSSVPYEGTSEPKPISSKLGTRNEEISPTTAGRPVNASIGTTRVHVTLSLPHAGGATSPTLSTTASSEPPARKVDILIYPTVSPETIVVPILSCIVGFPIFALLVICCLRRRAKIARERDRRRNFDLKANTITLVRFNSHHLNSQRSILLQSRDSLSRGYPSLDLDTVYEERSDTHGSTQFDSPAAQMLLTDSAPESDTDHC